MVEIGVLAVQGAFQEHESVLNSVLEEQALEGEVTQVRTRDQARGCDGLVLPGGESTTIDKLLDSADLRDVLKDQVSGGVPVLATCAGAILVSSQGDEAVERTETRLLGLVDASVERNAFGRQRESFEAAIRIPALDGGPFPGVFIRAPVFQAVSGSARPWARLNGDQIVGVEQGSVLALAFHPELSGDPRVHEAFVQRVVDEAP